MEKNYNDQKEEFVGIDLLKLMCALLVVFIHTCSYKNQYGIVFKNVVCNMAVPFFFITSGFLYQNSFSFAENKNKYMKRYLKKLIIMYMLWSIISLPVAIFNIEHVYSEKSAIIKVIALVRQILFVGSLGIYWYVLALILSILIISLGVIKKKEKIVYFVAIIGFIIGIFYQNYESNSNILLWLIDLIWGSERNVFCSGLFYVCIGWVYGKHRIKIRNRYLFIIMFIAVLGRYIEVCYFKPYGHIDLSIFIGVEAIGIFLIALHCKNCKLKKYALMFRRLSTVIYFTHFIFILKFDYFLENSTAYNFFCTLLWSIVWYFVCYSIIPGRYTKYLFGC